METAIIPLKKIACVDQICPYLYLGDIETSQDPILLSQLHITHIINLSNETQYHKFNHIVYYDIMIEDSKNADISLYFEYCIHIIEQCVHNQTNILIHCMCGVSRSVSIILSYLIHTYRYTLYDALNFVKSIRVHQYTHPNIGFIKQLMKYEYMLLGCQSITLQQYIQMK